MLAAVRPSTSEPLGRADRRWFVAAVLASVAALAAVLVVAIPHARSNDPTVDVAARLWLVVCTAVVLTILASRLPRGTKGLLIAVLVGSALMLGAAFILSANDFAPFGAALDQSHRTASITKFAAGWGWVDFAYKGLPASYPPLSFWVLGRLAALLSIAPWKMLKVDVLATAFLVPVLSWPLWRRVVGEVSGAAAVLAGALVFQAWYRPMAWLVVALFVPWWLWGVLGVGRSPARSRLELAVAAVIGAALLCTYYFPFFLGVLMLLVVLVLRRPAAARGLALPPQNLRDTGLVLGGTAVLSSPFWLPLAVSVLRYGYQSSFNRYYVSDFVDLRLRFLTFDVPGIVMLVGLVYLLLTARRSPISLALLGLLAAGLLYYVAGYVGVLANVPILSFQADEVIDAILGAAAGLALVDGWQFLVGSEWLRARFGRAGVTTAAVVAGVLLAFSLAQSAVSSIPYVNEQRASVYPATLLADFQRAAGGSVTHRVVLTDLWQLPTFLPVYVFNWWDTQASSPSSRENDRTAFLDRLSQEQDPAAFSIALLHNVYDRIDDVVLRPGMNGGFAYTFTDDAFPRPPVVRTFTYAGVLFATSAFRRVNTPSFTLFRVEPRGDPLRGLRACPRQPSRAGCQALGDVAHRFAGDVDANVLDLARRWEAARRGDASHLSDVRGHRT